jgi:3-phytase
MKALLAVVLAGGLLGPPALAAPGAADVRTVSVTARGETRPVGTGQGDAADDPAIWRNPRHPAASLIVATDKKAGLYVYGLDGRVRHFVAAGRVNNVDLVDLGPLGIIVVASDRNDEAQARLGVYRLHRQTGRLTALGSVPGGAGEAYGVCLVRHGDGFDAFSILKHGAIHQVRIALEQGKATGAIIRSLHLPSQTEGCVVDPRSGTLYVGEEDRGIWALSTDPRDRTARLLALADGGHLVADVEGLALAPVGRRGGWLVASSQGDNAYALFRLPDLTPAGRFRIRRGRFGSTEETDGIALALGQFGPRYPGGLFVAQDGENAPAAQNFKLSAWGDIRKALNRKR